MGFLVLDTEDSAGAQEHVYPEFSKSIPPHYLLQLR